jgi:hypothetical protein
MLGLPSETWLRLVSWFEIGLFIFAYYSWKKSRLAEPGETERSSPHRVIAICAWVALPFIIYLDYGVFFRHYDMGYLLKELAHFHLHF